MHVKGVYFDGDTTLVTKQASISWRSNRPISDSWVLFYYRIRETLEGRVYSQRPHMANIS